jgi:hypothetical protein
MSFTRLVLSLGSLAIVLTAASGARAQQCDAKVLCPKGFVCQISPMPTEPAVTDPAPGCAPDAKCSALVAPPTPLGGWCMPAPCTQDTECGAGMVCHSENVKTCSGGTAPAIACAPNSMCELPQPSPEVCTESTVSICAYKWQLPCNTDVDCGAGFNCTPVTTTTCSGGMGVPTPTTGGGTEPSSGSSGAAPADFAAPRPPDTCTTSTPSFPGYCQPKATTCTADAECPDAWTCVSLPTREPSTPVMGSGTGGGTATDTGATRPAPTADPIAPPPPTTTTMVCQSPIGSYGGTATVGTDAKGSSTGSPEPTVPPTAGGGQTTGQRESASPNAGGCAVGGGAGGSMLGLGLALVGILSARRRR